MRRRWHPELSMSKKRRDDKGRLPPFVPLLIETLDAPAWRAMSHGAKAVFIALKRRYGAKIHNNGKLFISQRDAKAQLRSDTKEIGRWFRELEYYGFAVMTEGSYLGLEGTGKAPHWRLTELG